MAAVGGQWVCVATMVDCMGGGLLGFVAVVVAVGGYGWVGSVVVIWKLWVCDVVLAGGVWVAMW